MAEQMDINENAGPIQGAEQGQSADSKERDEVQAIKKLFESAKKGRAEYDGKWPIRWKFYKGEQWEGTTDKPVMNICRSTVQSMLPLLTDAKPGINVSAPEPNDYPFAMAIGKVIEAWWEKPGVNMAHILLEPLMDMSIYDYGICKVFWDAEAENGAGDIRVKRVSPDDVFVNREAKDFDKDCYYVIERQRPTLAWLKRKFPDKAAFIKSDSSKQDSQKNEDVNEITLVSPTDQKYPIINQGTINESDCRETAEIWECWIDSEELEEYQDEKQQTAYKKKYPGGKLITLLPNQNVVLQSIDNPYKHGKKPYVRFVDAILPGKFQGEGEIEALMGQQKVVNKILDNLIKHTTLTSNPVWLNQTDSGVDSNDITNDVALVIEADDINKIKRDIPPAAQAGQLDVYQMALRNCEIVSGINDVSQGRRPVGITAGIAIESLQEASQTRIRLKERNLQVSLSKMGLMLAELIMQYYTSPRVAKITGQNQQWPTFFEYFFEQKPDGYYANMKPYDLQKDANGQPTGQYLPGNYGTIGPSKGVFDVKIQSGTSMPFNKTERMNLAMKLRQQGDLSREGLFNSLEWPEAAQELQRMQAEDQQKAQAAQQQAAMKGGASAAV